MLSKENLKSKMETENHCKNGANPKSHTSRRIFTVQMIVVLCLLFAGCSKDKNDGDDDGGGTSGTAELDNMVYCMKYAIQVSTDYNDKKLMPEYIQEGGITVAVLTYGSGRLPHYLDFKNRLAIVPFSIDMGSRPATICRVMTIEEAATKSAVNNGYDYDNDPSKLQAYFGYYSGSGKFTSLENMRRIANNNGITEEVYNAMTFPTNCYKIIVFGKNKAGKLIGKYAGYSLGKSYIYWDINPESSSFGKSGTKGF